MSQHRLKPWAKRWLIGLGIFAAVVVIFILLFSWDWFIPFVDARASAAAGRKVTVTHLHVGLGRVTLITADGITIANPPDYPAAPPLARIAKLAVQVDVLSYFHGRLIIPSIEIDQADIEARGDKKGAINYKITLSKRTASNLGNSHAPAPLIGAVIINDGYAHLINPQLRTNATATIATRGQGDNSQIVVRAKGTYAGQPVTGELIGGGVLTLRNRNQPYPIDLRLANGATHVSLVGTVSDPLHFAGAALKLTLTGTSMANLYPLTGIPLPKTPSYRIAGNLDYRNHRIRFTDATGTVGSSDIEGSVLVEPGIGARSKREQVTANLASRFVDLADLGGLIGSEPGRLNTPNQTAAQKAALEKAEESPKLLPDTPINLPKLKSTDVHLRYHGAKIEGKSVPFDSITMDLDMVNGAIKLHPIDLTVGTGAVDGTISLVPRSAQSVNAKADITLKHVDVSRLMAATHTFQGQGSLGGHIVIDSYGRSLAGMLGRGNGNIYIYMLGGNLSALLVDLAGLQFGKALLSALGLPERTNVQCMLARFDLTDGVLKTENLLLDTSSSIVQGSGTINLAQETLNYQIKTASKHFAIGSLPAPIDLTGPFKKMKIHPDVAALGIRGSVASGLGFVFPPLALLATIQFGVGEEHRCDRLFGKTATTSTRTNTGANTSARKQ